MTELEELKKQVKSLKRKQRITDNRLNKAEDNFNTLFVMLTDEGFGDGLVTERLDS